MNKFIIFLPIIIAILLRIYDGPELFFWNIDEDIVALTVKRMLVDLHVQLIGFPIPGGIYLGPIYYYLISVPYFLFNLDPHKLYLVSALFGALTTFLTYKTGLLLFEKKFIALTASCIYAFSYFSTIYGRILNGLSIAQILALLTYLLVFKKIKSNKDTNLIPLGFVLLVAS